MNQTAANLIDRVLPVVPIRQWVISFPMPLRFWLPSRPALRKVVLGIFGRVVFSWARRQARLAGHSNPQLGAVCFHQMFGSSLNLNLHFHLLALDGYYFTESPTDDLQFRATPAPHTEDIQRLVETIRVRVTRALVRRGFFDNDDPEPQEDALFAIQAASSAHRVAMETRAGRKAELLKRTFGEDALRCPRCSGRSSVLHTGCAVWSAEPGWRESCLVCWGCPQSNRDYCLFEDHRARSGGAESKMEAARGRSKRSRVRAGAGR